ncbi:MAG: FAD-dependent oxidoreductase [Hyphomicrobiales bacterium]
MYDAIVVGARCAGAPLAMNLARKGHRVVALDRGGFDGSPGDAQAMTGRSVYRMADWGLLERLKATGAIPIRMLTLTAGEGSVDIPYWGPLPGVCPRRGILDSLLAGAAREAGVELREHTTVTRLLRNGDGTVCGVEAVGPDGKTYTEEAKVVVGADGRDSLVAREVDAPAYNQFPVMTGAFYATYRGMPAEGIEMYFLSRSSIQVLPTDGGATVGIFLPIAEFEQAQADVEGAVERALAEVPGLALRIGCGKPESPWKAHRWGDSFYRPLGGPGWTLAGDAAFFKEPILGQGINDAFRDADNVSAAIHEGLTGGDMQAALDQAQAYRDERTRVLFQATLDFARFEVTPQKLSMLAAWAENLLR